MTRRFKVSANIERLFVEHDFADRFAQAADAGFDGVDIPLPYDHAAPDLRDKAIFAGLPILRIDAPPPNYTGGPQGYAAVPASQARFRRDVTRVLRQADVLRCKTIHLRAGLDPSADRATLADNLVFASELAPKVTFLIEALNPKDFPGHPLAEMQDSIDLVAELARPNLRLLFSSWHASRQPMGLAAAWNGAAPMTGHVLIGGGSATERDHCAADMMSLLKANDYAGWVCADYDPNRATRQSLGWLTA